MADGGNRLWDRLVGRRRSPDEASEGGDVVVLGAEGYGPVPKGWRPPSRSAEVVPAQALGLAGTGAVGVGAVAVAAIAIGAMAIGAVAIGALAVGRARVRRLEVGELTVRDLEVGRLRVRQLVVDEARGEGFRP